jgi:hypothetical protein
MELQQPKYTALDFCILQWSIISRTVEYYNKSTTDLLVTQVNPKRQDISSSIIILEIQNNGMNFR